jgi:hypothetical protein
MEFERIVRMRTLISATLLCGFLCTAPARAETCSLNCDYWHNYGPYDFSYVTPGLLGYPRCDRQGNCSPYLNYVYPGRRYGRITVRPVTHPRP